MAITFPANPTIGDTYTASNGRTWRWDGTTWAGIVSFSQTANLNADTLDSVDSTGFLRSNTDTTLTGGNLTLNKNSGDTILILETDISGTYDVRINMGSGQNGIATEGHQIWYDNSTGDTHFNNTWTSGRIRFHTATATDKVATGNNERMTITESGNVGIGTTDPGGLLDMRRDQSSGTSLLVRNAYAGTGVTTLANFTNNVDTDIQFKVNQSGATTKYAHIGSSVAGRALSFGAAGDRDVTIDGDGYVGIGNASPDQKLTIGTNNSTSDVGYIRLRGYDTLEGNIYKTASYGIHMDTNSNNQGIRIDGGKLVLGMTGNVGIGTDTPVSLLTVAGGSANWNETTPGVTTGSIHLDPENGLDNYGSAITWGASDASSGQNAQAGIYIRSDGSYGTRMTIATTDSYATGSKGAVVIDQFGDIYVMRGDLNPVANNAHDLGTSSLRWRNVYTMDLNLSNGIGDYTIVEGEEDLFLYNNKNGKTYKFLIQEVDPTTAPPKTEK